MNKQVILIYDLETNKILDVQDVRSMTPEKFAEFQKEAKKNLKEKIKEEHLKNREFEKSLKEQFEELRKENHDMKRVLRHLLGWEELDTLELEAILREIVQEPQTEGEPANEQ
jgi:tRNA U34 5-carboxymethylaminomethyl modifying enzyme MnmG/GidA